MAMNNLLNRAVFPLVLAGLLGLAGPVVNAQKPDVQRLFQSGSYEQAVEAARDADPASTYIAAQSLLKLDRPDRAGAEMTRLRASEAQDWRLIGESGEALIANDAGRAVELAQPKQTAATRSRSINSVSPRARPATGVPQQRPSQRPWS